MLSMLRGPLAAGLIAITMLCLTAASAHAGPVRIVRGTSASADALTLAPTLAQQSFMRSRYFRMRTFAPYFDARLAWAPGAWVNQHAFGLDLAEHPEWQLRDVYGSPVYVGTRVAADFGNVSFQSWWIARTQTALAAGYRGVFIDDAFMERRTTTSTGVSRMPIDPRTGTTMTEANWQRYMADFLVAVRAALPSTVEIVHDVLWTKGDANANVLRGLQAATYLNLDKGFNDTAIVYGTGSTGWQTLAAWIDRAQARGTGVILDGGVTSAATRLYGLATSLMVSNGTTALTDDTATGASGDFWTGYNLDLGAATSGRYGWSNVIRRDYAGGIVLVNEPYRSTRTITVPAGYQDLDGVARSSVTLAGGQGAVLVPIPVAPPVPTATPTPVPPVPPVATPVAPVSTPVAPATPTRTPTRTSSGGKARISNVGHTAGARGPSNTSLSVSGSRSRLTGTVKNAVAGYVKITVERKRGSKWVVARRVKVAVKRHGRFVKDIPSLPGGTYRVRGYFEGTGTSLPSRSSNRTFRA